MDEAGVFTDAATEQELAAMLGKFVASQ